MFGYSCEVGANRSNRMFWKTQGCLFTIVAQEHGCGGSAVDDRGISVYVKPAASNFISTGRTSGDRSAGPRRRLVHLERQGLLLLQLIHAGREICDIDNERRRRDFTILTYSGWRSSQVRAAMQAAVRHQQAMTSMFPWGELLDLHGMRSSSMPMTFVTRFRRGWLYRCRQKI